MPEDGKVFTIEPSQPMINLSEAYLARLGLRDKVEIIEGRALEVLPAMAGEFDLIYLDAVKEEYSDYLDLCLPKLRAGGIVIADNLLWGGRVAEEVTAQEESSTVALRRFNENFVNHPELKAEILSVGDGLGYAVKIA
jgi:predicted O-methyltransferase YrrM